MSFLDPTGYLCVCGQTFPQPEGRMFHMLHCQVWSDHKLGLEVLEKFPRDKYGGYVIAAPAIFIAFVRDAIATTQKEINRED